MELVIASSNRTKHRHLQECIKSLRPDIDVRSLLEFDGVRVDKMEDEDIARNMQEAAQQKALQVVTQTRLPALADETILIVPILWSSEEAGKQKLRFVLSGKKLPDTKALLKALEGKDDVERAAYLETTLALAFPDGKVYTSTVRQEGMITDRDRGGAHFDFGSVFLKHDYNKTLSELPESISIRISHRLKGLETLLARIPQNR